MSGAEGAQTSAARPGLDHLNAILLAKGYITKPLNFGLEPSSTSADEQQQAEGKKQKRIDQLDSFADLLTTLLAERDADLALKEGLQAKVRMLESSVDRKGKFLAEEIERRLDAQRKETAALVKAA